MLAWDAPLQRSLVRFGAALIYNFPPWTAVIGLMGLAGLYRKQKYTFWLILPLLFVHSLLAVTLTLDDPFSAYVPSFVLIAVAVGFGWWKVLTDAKWTGFVLAILLSLSPVLIYRFSAATIRWVREEVSVTAFLGPPFESPLDPLDHFLNPDRRHNPEARDFAREAIPEIPENARIVTPSRSGQFLSAPMRYMVDVEDVEGARAGVVWSTIQAEDVEALERWAARSDEPLFLIGLHPANPAVDRLLDRYDLVPTGPWFRVERRDFVPSPPSTDLPDPADPLIPLAGDWSGYVRPQGYSLSLTIRQDPDGSFSGRAVLNESSVLPREGNFNRISPIGDTVVGSITYADGVHVQIDAKRSEDRLEGTWQIFEAQQLAGSFVVQKR